GPRETDQAWQPLRAARSGDDPQPDLGQAEPGVLGGEPEVAREGDLEPTAQREPVDRGDRDLRDRLEVAAGLLETADVLGDLLRPVADHRLDVGTRRADSAP